MRIVIIPLLTDNYGYVIHDRKTAMVIDPSEAKPILSFLEHSGLNLTYILNTHHHDDHIGGNAELVQETKARLVAAKADAHRIPNIDIQVEEGPLELNELKFEVIHIPGHTSGHLAYYFPSLMSVFCGDTLFSMGCGRVFEGTPADMVNSLKKLSSLPGDTFLYCGHEYTEKNGFFAMTLEQNNKDLQRRLHQVIQLRRDSLPTLPSTMEMELATNPFLRLTSQEIRRNLNMDLNATEVEVFAEMRSRKDKF